MDDSQYLDEAIALAREALEDDEGGPFGAVVVLSGEIVGRARNRVLGRRDPTAHAEVEAIRNACRRLGTHDLDGAEIYASCEPCPMCLGAIYWAGIRRVVYAADRMAAARAGFSDALFHDEMCGRSEHPRVAAVYVERPESVVVMATWAERDGAQRY